MQESAYFDKYSPIGGVWDEMYGADSNVREHYRKVIEYISKESADDLNKKEELAKRLFMSQGITFTVYNSGEGIEKIFPFMRTIISALINRIMFLGSTQTSLAATGMMMILVWEGIQRMMIKQARRYGFGVYHNKE